RVVDRGHPEAAAVLAFGMIEVGASIDEDRAAVQRQPYRKRIGVAVRGERTEPQRSVIEGEMDPAAGDVATPDRVAALRKGRRAVGGCRAGWRRGEYDVAPMLVANGGGKFRALEKSGDRGANGGRITRFRAAIGQKHAALVVVADQGDMALVVEEGVQRRGCLAQPLPSSRGGCVRTDGPEADQQHLQRKGGIGRRLLLSDTVLMKQGACPAI